MRLAVLCLTTAAQKGAKVGTRNYVSIAPPCLVAVGVLLIWKESIRPPVWSETILSSLGARE